MKYQDEYGSSAIDVENLLTTGESIIWRGKPKRFAFIFNKCAAMFPIALLWMLFDFFFIYTMSKSGAFSALTSPMLILFFVAFFAVRFFSGQFHYVHLFPVWSWVYGVLTAGKRWQNTEYILTDRRIVIVTGFVNLNIDSVFYTDVKNVALRYSLFDKMLGVGDIYFELTNSSRAFLDLTDPEEVYTAAQKIVIDIQTDIHYPNKLRPDTNPGYTTSYLG